jgi:hypothetical protein
MYLARVALWLRLLVIPYGIKDECSAVDASSVKGAFDIRQERIELLKRYNGKPLTPLDAKAAAELKEAICGLIPDRVYNELYDYAPSFIWQYSNKDKQMSFVLLEINSALPRPSATAVRATILDRAGRPVYETTFTTGHRRYVQSVALISTSYGEYPVIAIETGGPGPDIAIQYYARIGNRLDAIRIEDSQHCAIRNRYHLAHLQSGPAVPKQAAAEWITDILAQDNMRVLRALTWLGGVHAKGTVKTDALPGQEGLEALTLLHQVRDNAKVVNRIAELASSNDQWLREAAEMALNPED